MNLKPVAISIAASVAATGAIAPSAPAIAQTPPAPAKGGKFFDSTDTNKDGKISKAEWDAAGRKPEGFAMMDLNKDGEVTREEGRAAMQKVMQRRNMPQSESN